MSLPANKVDGSLRPVAKHRKPAGTYHHGDLREALLTEALKFIEQHGLSELSLRDLARRLGVSPAAPYHHFANRTELLRALARHGFDKLDAVMREELGRVGEIPTDRLIALGRGYLRFAGAHPFHFRLMFRRECGPEVPPEIDPDREAFGLLRSVVIECLRYAGRASEDPTPSILAMWGGVHGLAALRLDGPLSSMGTSDEVEALCDHALRVLGLALSKRDAIASQ